MQHLVDCYGQYERRRVYFHIDSLWIKDTYKGIILFLISIQLGTAEVYVVLQG
jgi:hypothetical protein